MAIVRTRFAPSPTGYIHVGGIRTAVFAWLLARQTNGKFILRLEDTDKKREVEGSEKHIIESLGKLGLSYDEGPDIGGPYGPYRQGERLGTYKQWAVKLIESGRAYADPYSPDEVATFRDAAQANKKPFLFRNHRPETKGEQALKWDGSQPLRFKSEPKAYKWHDTIMGDLSAGPEVIDDFILIKSDGYPTYNFAHIVDDTEMKISHIIRGQEFISSVPNYLNLYEALGISAPVMATVPHVLGSDGNKKLSKRDGARDVLDYIRAGYMPEALINFIASLGWNDGSEQEIYSIEELIEKFSLDRVQRSGARFDEQRLLWMNGYYMRQLPLEELYSRAEQYWPEEAAGLDKLYKQQVLGLVQERIKYLHELPELTRFFFTDLPVNLDLITDHKQLKKLSSKELYALLFEVLSDLKESDFSTDDLTDRLNALLMQTKTKPSILFSLVRIATTQATASPGLAETMAVLGREVSLRRINNTLEALAS